MATLVFSTVGTLLGGPIGGTIGAIAGRQVDSMLFGGSRQGPRLKELTATTSSYGSVIPRLYGRMRIPGTVIWSTDLVEHSEKGSSGKGGPSVTTYTYTVSFSVALSSRPISAIGRIWADGQLLRGADGDLKTAGQLRVYTGEYDQDPDPLLMAAEGEEFCPAYRGLAYVVFEDLSLADFYNRIPALTFEVFSDEDPLSLQHIVDSEIENASADVALDGIDGFASESSLADTLSLFNPVFPVDCDASGNHLAFTYQRLPGRVYELREPALPATEQDFGAGSGYIHERKPVSLTPPAVLRYYDIERDYLPGTQRTIGRVSAGQPRTIDFPAAMTAQNARQVIDRCARHTEWSRDGMVWRTAELNSEVTPGALVSLQGQTGIWRVNDWEWREHGVELGLTRVVSGSIDRSSLTDADPGRANTAEDTISSPSLLQAFALPWNGLGDGDKPILKAAVSSTGSGWKGAALFVDRGDGNLIYIGASGRTRSILGFAENALHASNPLLYGRGGEVIVSLADSNMELTNAAPRQIDAGANSALLGDEIIQFAVATPLGGARWRLQGLLRGRCGTENAIGSHTAGERFVLLDNALVNLDPAMVGSDESARIVASGVGDTEPVSSLIALNGITLRPLTPVHPRKTKQADGSIEYEWCRRSRGSWVWADGVDAPLREEMESYQVSYGNPLAPLAVWQTSQPHIVLNTQTISQLLDQDPNGLLYVQQRGTFALSEAALMGSLN